jgi:hypothetical protein
VGTDNWESTNDKPTGEIGILQQVLTSDLIDRKLYIFVAYQGRRYMGLMAFDHPKFCYAIYRLLKSTIGLSIADGRMSRAR